MKSVGEDSALEDSRDEDSARCSGGGAAFERASGVKSVGEDSA